MTVIDINARSRKPMKRRASSAIATLVTGTFSAPSGCIGTFHGSYRLERLVTEHGHLAAAGIFAGDLMDADDSVIGTGSRRHTAAAVVEPSTDALIAELGPVEVNIIGFPVLVRAFEVAIPRELPPAGGASPGVAKSGW